MNKQASHAKPRRQVDRRKDKRMPLPSGTDQAVLVVSPDPHDQITLKPDGCYWQAENGRRESGPFESYELAAADPHVGEENLGPVNTLTQVEDEIGIAGWIDADTGTLAEGQSPPHLDRE